METLEQRFARWLPNPLPPEVEFKAWTAVGIDGERDESVLLTCVGADRFTPVLNAMTSVAPVEIKRIGSWCEARLVCPDGLVIEATCFLFAGDRLEVQA